MYVYGGLRTTFSNEVCNPAFTQAYVFDLSNFRLIVDVGPKSMIVLKLFHCHSICRHKFVRFHQIDKTISVSISQIVN